MIKFARKIDIYSLILFDIYYSEDYYKIECVISFVYIYIEIDIPIKAFTNVGSSVAILRV